MNIAVFLEQARAEGVTLELSSVGTIRAIGIQSAVEKWLPTIRDNKLNILCELLREPPCCRAEP